jgi:NPCBM/NEW2 domain
MAPEHRPSDRRDGDLRTRFSVLSFVQKVAVATVAAVLSAAIIALLGIQAFSSGSKAAPSQTKSATTLAHGGTGATRTETSASETPPPPAVTKYLAELSYKEGEAPERGEVQIAERKFKRSIFWEHAGGEGRGPDYGCENPYECKSVLYDLNGKYRHFTALVGGATATRSSEAFKGHWWVVLDGMIEQGSFTLNQPPVSVEVPVTGVRTLELRISAETSGHEPTLAWAEARVF